MMKEGTIIPQPLRVETEPYSRGWETIKNADADGVDRDIRRADWNFFFLAASIQATALGSWGERTVRRAMERVLAKAEPSKFNCLEITEISAKQFLGFPYGARLGALTTYPEEPISTRGPRTGRAVGDADRLPFPRLVGFRLRDGHGQTFRAKAQIFHSEAHQFRAAERAGKTD